MNAISWFLYLADVLSNAQLAIGLIIAGCVCFITFSGIGYAVTDGEIIDIFPNMKKYSARVLYVGIVLIVVIIFIPSKNTLYAIAASEVGEKLIANDDVKGIASDATKALQQWIKSQLKEDAKK